MNDRLKQFLAMEGLSPARFAEVMGIQRSGISHLLAGRNKPSFEFIQKMMTAYPDINYEWLILGKGRPYKGDHPLTEIGEKTDLFTDPPEDKTEGDLPLDSDEQEVTPVYPASEPSENREFTPNATLPPAKTGRRIARIIVFFNDGTYEEK